MPSQHGIHQLVTQMCEQQPELDDIGVAWLVLQEIPDADWRNELLPLVAAQVERTRRDRVRAAEVAAFGPRRRKNGPVVTVLAGAYEPDIDQLRSILSETFHLSDGTEVSWGAATVEQHQQRIAAQQRHLEGVQRDIDRHKTAIDLIRFAEAASLSEALAKRAA